jgi:hypothetical protein
MSTALAYLEIGILGGLMLISAAITRHVLKQNKQLTKICAQQALEIDRMIRLVTESQKLVALVREGIERGRDA